MLRRSIKATFGRYVAILAIVALGVGFFAGLKSSEPAMSGTADDYLRALQEPGFEYEITIYRDYQNLEILNDPDFETVFELFRAHTKF